jgi:2-methylisocitrate lyase-like PEP mutase family enzyme
MDQGARAKTLRSLHETGTLVLPNAWDAGSAVLIARAGASAIATTSGGVSWSADQPDGQRLSRSEMIGLVGRIADAVDIPVTADIEGGYGASPDEVLKTVADAIAVGVAGVNIEDSRAPGGPLFEAAEQAARIEAGRAAARQAGSPSS